MKALHLEFMSIDKYQQVLYENTISCWVSPIRSPININRCCTKTIFQKIHLENTYQININRCCTKTPLIITTLISLLLDKYQQVLYENVSSPPPITKPITDKYQQVLYENHFLNICKCFFYQININRCCTKTYNTLHDYYQ